MTTQNQGGQNGRTRAASGAPLLDARFVGRAILVLALIALGFLLMRLSGVILLAFGAVIVAVTLRTVAGPLHRRTPLPKPAALALTVVLMLGLIVGFLVLFGREISVQVGMLLETLPQAINALARRMETNPLGRLIVQQATQAGEGTGLLNRVPSIAYGLISGVASLSIVIVTGAILAAKPDAYRDGLVSLFPPESRERLRTALNHSGHALKLWLWGQFIAMATIGVLTGLGLWLAGVPSAIALGLFAGLAQFVPLIGPIASAVPGLILAGAVGGDTFIWALVVYVGVQQFESNLLTPIVERRMASLPIPITLFAVVAFGVLFGLPGIIVATPLAVVFYVLVKQLYLHDMLGDEVSLPGGGAPPPPVKRVRKRRTVKAAS
jgi:predicted PurR-regulated permease PerM